MKLGPAHKLTARRRQGPALECPMRFELAYELVGLTRWQLANELLRSLKKMAASPVKRRLGN